MDSGRYSRQRSRKGATGVTNLRKMDLHASGGGLKTPKAATPSERSFKGSEMGRPPLDMFTRKTSIKKDWAHQPRMSSPNSPDPLRSMYINTTGPRHTNRAQLLAAKKMPTIVHSSYDIDGDGIVSAEDYKIAKRFDIDGNGVIDEEEAQQGKAILAKELLQSIKEKSKMARQPIDDDVLQKKIDELVTAKEFVRNYNALRNLERHMTLSGSPGVSDCLGETPTRKGYTEYDQEGCADKPGFDASLTLRGSKSLSELQHSRKKERMFTAQTAFDRATPEPRFNFGRIASSITNYSRTNF